MKDFLGNELYVGDKVVYTGKNRALEQGIITEIYKDNFGRHKVIIDNLVIKIADVSVVKVDLNSVDNVKIENTLDKATPKKPILVHDYDGLVYECPICHEEFRPDTIMNHVKWKGCPYCLQKLDWSDEEC